MYNKNNSRLCKHVNRINLNLLHFGHAQVNPGWKGEVFAPVLSRLYYIIKGSFVITTADGLSMRLEAGKWYLLPANCSFKFSCEEQMEHIYFHLKLCDFDETDLLRNCAKPLRLAISENQSAFIIQCINSNNIVDGLLMRQIVYDVLLSMIAKNKVAIKSDDYSPCIYRALQYIKQNLSVRLTISEIAENVFVSKSTLTKHFQKELSMSVNEYIYNLIMSEAGNLLLTSNISILAVSEKFGFSDQLYFSRRFKEKFGKSPREYRKRTIL